MARPGVVNAALSIPVNNTSGNDKVSPYVALSAAALRTSEASAAVGISLAATAPRSSLDRLLAEAELRDMRPANAIPWYYRAWPESTFRNLIIYSAQLNRTAAPQAPIDSFAGLLEEVIKEA